jgi:hypothetical protein
MSTPTTITDKAQGLTKLLTDIGKAEDAWEEYADEVTADYAWAWDHQGSVLRDVHDRVLTRLKAEEESAVFVLNLLTVGVGGKLAGTCVKKIIGSTLEEEAVKKMAEFATDKIKEPIKTGNEWIAKHLGSEPSEDPFKPPGVSPTEYGARLQKGIHSRAKVLKTILSDGLSGPNVSVQGVQKLAEIIYNSEFMRDLPPALGEGQLKVPALLGLWLSWAWERDEGYWQMRSGDLMSYGKNIAEALDFEPVRQDLKKYGVPVQQMSHYAMIVGNRRTDDLSVIDMYAFIQWANSMDVVNVLFRGTNAPTEMQKKIQYQLMLRRMIPKPFRVTAEAG